jgi:hypothetical protein
MTKSIYPSLEKFLESKFILLPSLTILYWALYQSYTTENIKETNGFIFGILIALLAFIASFFTLLRSFEWEMFKSYLGKSLFFLSLALFAWGIGQTLFLLSSLDSKFDNMYDYVFVLIDPLYLIGIYFISKSLNTFKEMSTKIKVFLITFFIFAVNIFFFSLFRNEEIITSLTNIDFNLLFILGSIILWTFVISILVLSGKKIGGKFKTALYFILVGLLLQYLGDNLFEFSSEFQTNGSIADLTFFLSILFIFNGVVKLNPRSLK